MTHVAFIVAFASVAVFVEGDTEGLGRRVLLWILTGSMMALLFFAVVVRFGAGVAVGGALM